MKKLCLLAISYNEENHIKFWIDNHKEFVDEIILVDTGSTDNTIKIAEENGIKVFNYQWEHHFAHAKNFALKCCDAEYHPDWIFFLSPDYWVSKDDMKKIRAAIEIDTVDAYMTRLMYHHNGWFDLENTTTHGGAITRRGQIVLYKNDPAIFYRGKIHESVNISLRDAKKKINYLDITRHHDDASVNKINREIYFDALLAIAQKRENYSIPKLDLLRKKLYEK